MLEERILPKPSPNSSLLPLKIAPAPRMLTASHVPNAAVLKITLPKPQPGLAPAQLGAGREQKEPGCGSASSSLQTLVSSWLPGWVCNYTLIYSLGFLHHCGLGAAISSLQCWHWGHGATSSARVTRLPRDHGPRFPRGKAGRDAARTGASPTGSGSREVGACAGRAV